MKLLKLFRKRNDSLVNESIKFEPFDYGFLLDLEKQAIIKMKDYFKESNLSENDEQIYKDLRLASQLLNIILGNDQAYHYNNGESYVDIYINSRNSKRFLDYEINTNPLLLDDLRVQKAWYLYHKLRYERMRLWWN